MTTMIQEQNAIRWTFLDNVKPLSHKEENKLIVINEEEIKNKIMEHFQKHEKKYVASGMVLSTLAFPLTGMAASTETTVGVGGASLIILLQKAAFYLGMGVVIWGIVESMLEFPGWKGRITKGLLGYIGILLVPLVFLEIQNSLQVDVWNRLNGGK